jgi:hypothetical protein
MVLFLTILEVVFGVSGALLLIRSAWLLARGQYRHGFIHMGLAALAFVVAVGFILARDLFSTAA